MERNIQVRNIEKKNVCWGRRGTLKVYNSLESLENGATLFEVDKQQQKRM